MRPCMSGAPYQSGSHDPCSATALPFFITCLLRTLSRGVYILNIHIISRNPQAIYVKKINKANKTNTLIKRSQKNIPLNNICTNTYHHNSNPLCPPTLAFHTLSDCTQKFAQKIPHIPGISFYRTSPIPLNLWNNEARTSSS